MSHSSLNRSITADLAAAGVREWLATNGIGGYGSGTVAGQLARRYHGYLVAALDPPLGRTLLLAKLDETVHTNGASYPLFTNQWTGGHIDPHGYRHIKSFHLDGSIPTWRFTAEDGSLLGNTQLDKRIWMEPGANTTYIHYTLARAGRPLTIELKAFANYRDYHSLTQGGEWQMAVDPVLRGLRVSAFSGAVPFYLLSERAKAVPAHEWYSGFDLAVEQYRGMEHSDDHLLIGHFQATLEPGQSLTLVASTEEEPSLDGHSALEERRRYERALVIQAGPPGETTPKPERSTPKPEGSAPAWIQTWCWRLTNSSSTGRCPMDQPARASSPAIPGSAIGVGIR